MSGSVAERIAEAIKHCVTVPHLLPEEKPRSVGEAYAIQAEVAAVLGNECVGWKVGATADAAQKLLKTDQPFLGPVLRSRLHSAPADLHQKSNYACLVEAEYVFVLKGPLRGSVNEQSVLDVIDRVCIGLEICRPRFEDWAKAGVLSLISDLGVTDQTIIGEELANWPSADLTQTTVTLRRNGETAATGSGQAVLGDPLASLAWALEELDRQNRIVSAGDVVFTGSCTGMTPAHGGDQIEADFGPFGSVRAVI